MDSEPAHRHMYTQQCLDPLGAAVAGKHAAYPPYPPVQHAAAAERTHHSSHPLPPPPGPPPPPTMGHPEQPYSPHYASNPACPPPISTPSHPIPHHGSSHSSIRHQHPPISRPLSLHSSPYQQWATGGPRYGDSGLSSSGTGTGAGTADIGRKRHASDSPPTPAHWSTNAPVSSEHRYARPPPPHGERPGFSSPLSPACYPPDTRTYPPPHVHSSAPVGALIAPPPTLGGPADRPAGRQEAASGRWPRRSLSGIDSNNSPEAERTEAAAISTESKSEDSSKAPPGEKPSSSTTARKPGSAKRRRDANAEGGPSTQGGQPKAPRRSAPEGSAGDENEDQTDSRKGYGKDGEDEEDGEDAGDRFDVRDGEEAAKILEERRKRNANASARFRKRRNERERELVARCLFLEQKIFELVGLKSFDEIMVDAPKASAIDGVLKRRPIPSASSIASPISTQLAISHLAGSSRSTGAEPDTAAGQGPSGGLSIDALTAPHSASDMWALCLELKEQMAGSLERISALEERLEKTMPSSPPPSPSSRP
ncbi:hypothetical protein GQ54DRAFT_212433 [Martensiomyces pterosporus]|nr:hypothetical protein GQ54DRAFT_212433 [Martensiomyces pterosporus]